MAILFGTLVMPSELFNEHLSPILFQLNLLAGILLISKRKKMKWFLLGLWVFSGIVLGLTFLDLEVNRGLSFLRMGIFFLFYLIVTIEIIKQVWISEVMDKKTIFGLISGYVSLGLLGFFLCLIIEVAVPHSFGGLVYPTGLIEGLIYYSYVTLLTIGYGDILPVTPLAQKAAILIGLMGQFYLVIITAAAVGKHINQVKPSNK